MPGLRTKNGVFLIVLMAALGFLLVYVPPKVVELYEHAKGLGPPFTYFYIGMVGTGAAILLLLGGGIVWKLWQATRGKAERRARGAKNPSQLTAEQQRQEVADNLAAAQELQSQESLP